jgi:hypothetical protein
LKQIEQQGCELRVTTPSGVDPSQALIAALEPSDNARAQWMVSQRLYEDGLCCFDIIGVK